MHNVRPAMTDIANPNLLEGRPRLDGAVFVLAATSAGLIVGAFFASGVPVATGFLLVGAVFTAGWAVSFLLRWSVIDVKAKEIVREYRPVGLRTRYPFEEFVGVRRVLVTENEGEPYRIDIVLDRSGSYESFVFSSFSGVPLASIEDHERSRLMAKQLACMLGLQCNDEGFNVARV